MRTHISRKKNAFSPSHASEVQTRPLYQIQDTLVEVHAFSFSISVCFLSFIVGNPHLRRTACLISFRQYVPKGCRDGGHVTGAVIRVGLPQQ